MTGFIDKPTQPSTQQPSVEEDWDKVLRPDKKKVIDCKELGDECKFYEDWEEMREWRSWSGDHIFEPPEPLLKDIISPQTHEKLHKQLYELIINGKQQEALKLWDEFFSKVLVRRLETLRQRGREYVIRERLDGKLPIGRYTYYYLGSTGVCGSHHVPNP